MRRLPISLPSRLLERENQLFLALTIIIGVLAGLSAVLFALAIDAVHDGLFGLHPSRVALVAVPVVGSLIAGVLLATFFQDVRGSGIPQTEAAYRLHDGVIPAHVPFGKFLMGALCIGSGHSLGREGPSVQIGAGLASIIGRLLRLPPSRVRSLVPVGAAAALSAAFNTPVAAVIFALEEIIGDMNAPLVGSTVTASIAAVIVERAILGSEPLYRVPSYHLVHPAELLAYGVLGVVGGGIAVVFCKSLLWLRLVFRAMPSWTTWARPAIGGLVVGILFLWTPQVMGVGYEYVDQALNGSIALKVLVLLCAAKLAATVISYASGNAGGIFAPSLYLGAMTGGAVGVVVHQWAPFPTGAIGGYALVGMGALFAGIVRAPMTSVFMIFEITQDYQILVPLIVANVASLLISRLFQHVPLYHALLEQDGVHLPHTGVRASGGKWRVAHLVEPATGWQPPDAVSAEVWPELREDGRRAWFVGEPAEWRGLLTRAVLERAVEDGGANRTLAELATREVPHVHPDHPIDVALERLRDSDGILPVLNRANTRLVEGVVTAASVARFLDGHPAVSRRLDA